MSERIVKPCVRCGSLLQIRRNRASGEEFLGCSSYPECDYTEELPEAIKLRRAGQRDLFEEGPES
jgi:ssDNA-binding Zn-finger/Zn-ribbon topoisomerase 1